MRAKVTLTCDLNEAPDIVIDILRSTSESLRSLSNEKFNYWQVGELLDQIHDIRSELENIDNKLNDATNIATGWLEVMIGATDEVADANTAKEDVDEKEEQL